MTLTLTLTLTQLEGSLGFPSTFHLAGELVKKSVRSCRVNLDSLTTVQGVATAPAMDVLQWDCIINPALRCGGGG